jgi:hypothetical protein
MIQMIFILYLFYFFLVISRILSSRFFAVSLYSLITSNSLITSSGFFSVFHMYFVGFLFSQRIPKDVEKRR